jgi:hypothetical protein
MRSIDESLVDVHEMLQMPAPVEVVVGTPGLTMPNDVAGAPVQPLVSEIELWIVIETTAPELAPFALVAASAAASMPATAHARTALRTSGARIARVKEGRAIPKAYRCGASAA